ncbi:MAG: methylated-DNA--[protein]-cysteine S-methyltransferase [Clostridiales bacterium]|nr:methylated-DNA--[protein]-cysteine S-methyltransferase [Clostridiales bacterium]
MKQTDQKTQKPERVRMETPIGALVISARGGAVTAIGLAAEEDRLLPAKSDAEPVLNRAAAELAEYFSGGRTTFSFAMRPEGTPFQKSVWDELLKIPYGETKSYGQIAAAAGNSNASRAVGMACNKNPIMIAVPCHRVIGASGSLTGYALGTDLKQTLLDHERGTRPSDEIS